MASIEGKVEDLVVEAVTTARICAMNSDCPLTKERRQEVCGHCAKYAEKILRLIEGRD